MNKCVAMDTATGNQTSECVHSLTTYIPLVHKGPRIKIIQIVFHQD